MSTAPWNCSNLHRISNLYLFITPENRQSVDRQRPGKHSSAKLCNNTHNGVVHSVSKQWDCKHGYIIQRLFSMEPVSRPLLCNFAVNTSVQQQRGCDFSVVRVEGLYWRQLGRQRKLLEVVSCELWAANWKRFVSKTLFKTERLVSEVL
jgi:hypothetical protein